MKIFNDCPICNNMLIVSRMSTIHCNKCLKYIINSFQFEYFVFNGYTIRRSRYKTEYLANNQLLIYSINKVLDFNKFNTTKKIENLLAII